MQTKPISIRKLLKIPRSKKYYHEIKELLSALRFFLKSFYFFSGRIARYTQSKESRNLLKNVAIKRAKSNAPVLALSSDSNIDEVSIP